MTNPPCQARNIYLISEMPSKVFNSEMEEFLEETILTGLKGRIYEVIVLKKVNQKIKICDAWAFVEKKFNQKFYTKFSKRDLQKKYCNMVARRRKTAVNSLEKTRAKTMAQFCSENSKTGRGGPGILPPEFDPENPPDGDLLPLPVENDLRVSLPPVHSQTHSEVNTVSKKSCPF